MSNVEYVNKVFDLIEQTRNLQYGIMIRSVFSGKTHAHMDDVTSWTEGQALDEAYRLFRHDRNCLLSLFSVNMATGAIAQVINMSELVDYCEQHERNEMTDEERRHSARVDAAERSDKGRD